MCFDLDSEPPIPRIAGASVSHDDLTLTAADRNRLAAFLATPDEESITGVVVLPDVRGLYRFYEELALRFAERGHAAVAIDYFGRTAGVARRDDDFEYGPHVQKTTPDGLNADIAAGIAALRERGATPIFTVGFCFGGRTSWLAAASHHGLAGAVGFYGDPQALVGLGFVRQIECPILALQAGADQNITAEVNAAFDEALTAQRIEHDVVTYDGAPHSFFDRKQEQFLAASDDAWQRTLEFIARHA